jgi:FlaG/FlaF family flagellin (archaellin)
MEIHEILAITLTLGDLLLIAITIIVTGIIERWFYGFISTIRHNPPSGPS